MILGTLKHKPYVTAGGCQYVKSLYLSRKQTQLFIVTG